MSPAERLVEIRAQLSAVYELLDHLAGELEEPERDAAIALRADVGLCLRRAKGLAMFVARERAS